MMKRAAFFCNKKENIDNVFAQGRKQRIAELTDLYGEVITQDNFEEHSAKLEDLEVIFSTWGMPPLSDEQLDKLPGLQAVFYGAGSVKGFAGPLLDRGITIMSAWVANASPVAELTLAQILLSCKGYYRNIREYKEITQRLSSDIFKGKGNFGEKICIIGVGMVGRKLVELLKNFTLKVLVCDPYLDNEAAASMGVEKVTLEEAFSQGYVISNHVPDIPDTKGMLNRKLFMMMRENATFINTARGATVVENDLIAILKERPDVTALLDVTWPEPPEEASELYLLPNVYLTSHIAGSLGDEVVRMADFCIDEFMAWQEGRPMKYAISKKMLETMA